MSTFNHLLVLSVLLSIIMSATATKTCWPELVGKAANEAVEVIKQESGRKEKKQSIEKDSSSLI